MKTIVRIKMFIFLIPQTCLHYIMFAYLVAQIIVHFPSQSQQYCRLCRLLFKICLHFPKSFESHFHQFFRCPLIQSIFMRIIFMYQNKQLYNHNSNTEEYHQNVSVNVFSSSQNIVLYNGNVHETYYCKKLQKNINFKNKKNINFWVI